MKAFKSLVLGTALAMSIGSAQAVTYNAGTDTYNVDLKPVWSSEVWSWDMGIIGNKGIGSFTDTFKLSLAENSFLWFGAAEADSKLNISALELWAGNSLIAVGQPINLAETVSDLLASWGQTLTNGTYFLLSQFKTQAQGPEALNAGDDYTFIVKGELGASTTRYYKFGVLAVDAPATVPLPPALLLLGSGIAGLGALARRRKNADA